jgi:hypothetical protein
MRPAEQGAENNLKKPQFKKGVNKSLSLKLELDIRNKVVKMKS